ncbi:hypothetical protein JCM11641_001104 [Rhodosporidiobolus odoratus]
MLDRLPLEVTLRILSFINRSDKRLETLKACTLNSAVSGFGPSRSPQSRAIFVFPPLWSSSSKEVPFDPVELAHFLTPTVLPSLRAFLFLRLADKAQRETTPPISPLLLAQLDMVQLAPRCVETFLAKDVKRTLLQQSHTLILLAAYGSDFVQYPSFKDLAFPYIYITGSLGELAQDIGESPTKYVDEPFQYLFDLLSSSSRPLTFHLPRSCKPTKRSSPYEAKFFDPLVCRLFSICKTRGIEFFWHDEREPFDIGIISLEVWDYAKKLKMER